ncbi:MAG TPA: hypothetical protein VNZ52_12990 [Candidatus Thermoplasmatota archaeon]|nr:hypothetical protein [Candidatus Thermoplasmatota archaeon]
MVDVGRREQFTAGAALASVVASGVGIVVAGVALAANLDALVGALLTVVILLCAFQLALGLLLLARYSSALKFLVRSLGERRRLRRTPPLLSSYGRRRP